MEKNMGIKVGGAVVAAIVGLVTFFATELLAIGYSHRQPAEVTLDKNMCRYLPHEVHAASDGGLCRVIVDDLRKDGKLLELWWKGIDSSFSAGRTITIPVESLRIAVDLPRKPVPRWVYLLEGGAFLLVMLPLVWYALYTRKRNSKC